MSAFECNVTPTRVRNDRKKNEDREPTLVDLRPFSGKAIVIFEDVPITKTARRTLIISNPFEEPLQVSLTKIPKQEFNLSFEWTSNTIPSSSNLNLELTWNPVKVVSSREILQISDVHGNRKDIAVVLKSRELKKATGRKVAPVSFQRVLKLKSPSPPKNFFSTQKPLEVKSSPLRNVTNTPNVQFNNIGSVAFDFDKENNPSTPLNATAVFDHIKFTPVTETKPKSHIDYLTSLPTPASINREDIIFNFNTQDKENCPRKLVTVNEEGVGVGRKAIDFEEVASETFVRTQSIDEIQIIVSQADKTHVVSSSNVNATKIISDAGSSSNMERTYQLNKSHGIYLSNVDIQQKINRSTSQFVLTENSDYESRKLKINQGSMPNLNDINTVHGAIEHNRYYRQSSAPDNQNVSIESHADFRETEFCAQSSQLNIDPESPEKRSRPSSPIMSKHLLHVQFSDNVRSKQVQSPLHLSPTMKRIQEDPEFKPISPKKSVFQMTFSPPRKSMSAETLRRETFVVPRQGRQIRATTWKQQQNKEIFKVPKELKLTSSAAPRLSTQSLHSISNSSISSTASMPSNLTSGRLYNENILMPNNDPFSATTTQDPFLSSTMYLNDKKLDSIEKAYIKWLNALVTIPADLESDKNEKIDVGKLFSDVQCKELSIAQTKEVVASKYYTSRLDSLRSAAIRLIQSQEITSVLTKITVAVNSDKDPLGVKNERPIHLDLVLQRSLLELLLCYNPLWLRISLEVVFNVQLNLTSNHDILGMTRFIVSRMFKDQYILDKMGRLPSRRNEMLLQLRRHTVKHLLFILYFLDRAKENRLIKQNPCLFVRRAPYKESNDILKKLASLVLSNYGDVMRHMKRYDFVLTHKQTVIDEFDYAFKNLAIDLRDGVRLTKVMEIILMRDDLVNKVRVPAISRLQKVHNVDLALKALEAAEYKILGDITAKDIADGHREKTLSLLWQIIYKFRAPKFNAAAKVIQKFWRSKFLKIFINRAIRQKKEERRTRAAITIQRFFRGWRARKSYRRHLHEVTESCIVLQKHIRGLLTRIQYKKTIQRIVKIQKWFRSVLVMRKEKNQFVHIKSSTIIIQKWWKKQLLCKKLVASSSYIRQLKEEAFHRHHSAIIIQRTFKSYVTHKKFHAHINSIVKHNRQVNRTNFAATKIQALFRMISERKRFQEVKSATILIQRKWRHISSGQKCQRDFLKMKLSAIKLQTWFRNIQEMKKQRSEFMKLKNCVKNVQSRFRANLAMKQERRNFLEVKSSAIILQRRFRSQLEMKKKQKEFKSLKSSTIIIQRRLRANQIMKYQRNKFCEMRLKTILVQRKLRATLLMRKQRESFSLLKSSVILIQQKFKAKQAMLKERKNFESMKNATVAVQRRFRAQIAMKKSRNEFQKLRNAAIIFQRQFRAQQKMKLERDHFNKLKKITIHLQQKYRSTKQMQELTMKFYSIQYYTTFIQQKFRAKTAMKKDLHNFQELKKATICFQRRFRAHINMKKEKKNFQEFKSAVECIQRKWRATLQMRIERKNFTTLRNYVIKTQQRFRANLKCKDERENFMRMKKSVGVFEKYFLALKAMRECQSNYNIIVKSAVIIQKRFRANQLMKSERISFLLKKKSIILIQNYYRGFIQTKREREKFLTMKRSAIIIQQRFKAHQIMLQQKNEYQKVKSSVILIQRRFKAQKSMKLEREKFMLLKSSVIIIQRRYRGQIAMRKEVERYLTLRINVMKIQQKWRATLEMRRIKNIFDTFRKSASVIQNRWRALKMMRLTQDDYRKKKSSAIKIQQYFRGYLEMKKQRRIFLEIKSAVKIQRKFRATLEMRRNKEEYNRVRNSIVKIQNFYRATLKMRVEREIYQQSCNSIIYVQRLFRANQAMKFDRENFLKQKSSAIKIQKYFRGHLETVKEKNKFLQLKKAVIVMENKIIANRLMKIERQNFLVMKSTAIFIQKRFRSKIETREAHKQFKQTKQIVSKLQTRIRGFLARKRFNELQTPERIELRRQNKAARKIQAAYRGYRERNKKCNRQLKDIAHRLLKLSKKPSETLGEILKVSIDFLNQKSYDSNDSINFLAKLEYMSRTVPWILTHYTEFIATFCYGLMAQAIRSEIDKIIIELCSCIILNLARYKDTAEEAFLDDGLLTIAQMLLRWCDKDCGIFNTLCTVVWVFAHCEKRKMIIRNFMLMKDGEFLLSQIKQMVIRKENMRRNSRRPIGFQSISLIKYKKDYQLQLRYKSNVNEFSSGFITPQMLQQCRELPSLNPDFGVVKLNPYIFYSSVFAYDCILKKLNISNIH